MGSTIRHTVVAAAVVASALITAGPAAAAPSGWIEDFCSDRSNWEKVEDWTGQVIDSRADCQSALRGLRG